MLLKHAYRQLYLWGPRALGFWGGAEQQDICSSITSVSGSFWARNAAACADLIDRRIQSVVVLVRAAVITALMWHTLVTFSVAATALCAHTIARQLPRLKSPHTRQ